MKCIPILIYGSLLLLLSACEERGALNDQVVHWTEVEHSESPIIYCQGQKVFPLELYSLKDSTDFQQAKELGFNAAIGHELELEALCLNYDFMLTDAHWLSNEHQIEGLIRKAERLNPKLKILAHNLNDEPDLRRNTVSTKLLAQAAETLHRTLPNRKTSITLSGVEDCVDFWSEYDACADIIRVDPYPLIEDLPFSFVDTLMLAAQKMSDKPKPILCVLQGWGWQGAPFPTATEITHQAVRAILNGAAGLSYFSWNPAYWAQYPDYFKAVGALNACINSLMQPYLLEGQAYQLKEQHGILLRQWKLAEEDFLILATNTSMDSTRRISIALPSTKSTLYHLPSFEKESLNGNVFNGNIPALQSIIISNRHVDIEDYSDVVAEQVQQHPSTKYSSSKPTLNTPMPKPIVVTQLAHPIHHQQVMDIWKALADSIISNKTEHEAVNYQYKLAVHQDTLYWLMRSNCQHEIRQETTKDRRYYVGDDVAKLFFNHANGSRGLLQLNANGVARIYSNKKDQIGKALLLEPLLAQKSQKDWSFALKIPWKTLGIKELEKANLNLGYGYNIAPKQRLYYNNEKFKN